MLLAIILGFRGLFEPPTPMQEVEQFMAFGQWHKAYKKLSEMIDEKSPAFDGKLLIHRAQCCFQMLMAKECIADCQTILKHKGASMEEVRTALSFRANAHLILGQFEAAEKDAKSANDRKTLVKIVQVKKLPKIAEAQYENGQIEAAKRSLDELLEEAPKATKYLQMRAELAWMESDTGTFERLTEGIADELPNDAKLQYRRGLVLLCANKADEAKVCLKQASVQKKAPANTSLVLNAANEISTFINKIDRYIELKDGKNARISLNRTAVAARQVCQDGTRLISRVNLLTIRLMRMTNCTKGLLELVNNMIDKSPDDLDLVLERGEIQLALGDYDAAMFEFNLVATSSPGNQRAANGLERAMEMKKQATHVDHYAVLNITKTADVTDIKDAYKRKVREWHPDQFSDKNKKKEAEKMMRKINTAYEILNDPRKRRIYDAGHDPDDPENEGFDPFNWGDGNEEQVEFGNPFDFLFGNGQGQKVEFGNGQEMHFEFHF